MPPPRIDFWFEFASTYSYLSAMRLPALAKAAGVDVRWRPFLLGPIFSSQGWQTSPFLVYPAKGAYMWRDMERRSAALGLAFHRPAPFPQHSLLAARVAQAAPAGPEAVAYCQAVYRAQFAERQDISEHAVIAACAAEAGLPEGILERALAGENKQALREATEEAAARGLFGAPSFTVGAELFWGDDRLEDALDWAVTHG